jgi:drug/metabolite transporter (DMT)-like permease
MHTKALIALAFTILIWGITSAYARAFSLAASPTEALIIRTIISAVLFATALAFTTGYALPRADWPRLAVLALIGMLGYYSCSVFGFAYAPAGLATLVFSTQPLMIAVAASLVGTEKLTPAIIIGLIISMAGTGLLLFDDPKAYALDNVNDIIWGVGFMLLSCLAWTVYVIFTRPLIQAHGAIKITGLSCIIIALPLLPFVDAKTIATVKGLNNDAVFSLVFLTTLAATSSVATWNYAAGHLRPTTMGSSMYVIPLIAIVSAWFILGEPITSIVVIAGAIILLGVGVAEYGEQVFKPKKTG